jgi:hypothetical protein
VIASSFVAKKLDIMRQTPNTYVMGTPAKARPEPRRITGLVRRRIERGGERLWRLEDFRDLPFSAVAQALSRMAREGGVERLSKGVYYRNRETVFGKSRPNPTAIRSLASRRKTLFPSGIAAANLLGFTTQMAKQGEIATSAGSLPRKLVGRDTVIHTRRPESWTGLSETDAALLDFLRQGGKFSELSPGETIRKTLALLSEQKRLDRLLKITAYEPPRVRAMLGALGERLGASPRALRQLRASLNPFSRFDFGLLAGLPNARAWQAKEPRS